MASTFKTLKRRQKEIEVELEVLRSKKKEISNNVQQKLNQLSSIQSQMRDFQKGVVLSEHATLRWLERIDGINIEEIKKKILTKKLLEQVKTLGNGIYPIEEFGARAKIRNNVIVTIEPLR